MDPGLLVPSETTVYLNHVSFAEVWSGIVGLNSVAMALIYLFFPETLNKKQNDDKKEKENLSIIGGRESWRRRILA